ncbi:MAG: hypothetical protein ACEPOZ_03110 [Marinifilaceae bacterium]|jgi:tetratricopeptide (TPR) repeat protein
MRLRLLFILSILISTTVSSQNIERYKEYHDAGRMLILEGKYKEAIPQLDTAIAIMHYYPTIYQDRGYAKMQLKDYEGALSDFNHVLEKKPYMKEVRLQRAMALFHLNELSWAEEDLLIVLKDSPVKSKEAVDYLYQVQNALQKQAEEAYQRDFYLIQAQLERERILRARHREQVIWNTVVPLAFWTTVFLTW